MSLKKRIAKRIRGAYEKGKAYARAARPFLGALNPMFGGLMASGGGDEGESRAAAARKILRGISRQAGGGLINYSEEMWE